MLLMTAYLLGLSEHEYSNFHSAMLFMSNCTMALLLTRYCVHTEFIEMRASVCSLFWNSKTCLAPIWLLLENGFAI